MAETSNPNAELASHIATALDQSLDAEARCEAIDAITERAESETLPDAAFDALIALLADASEDVREKTQRALAECPSPRAVEPLIDAVNRERTQNARWVYGGAVPRLCTALGACGPGDARALTVLISLLHVEVTKFASIAAFGALFAMGPKAAGAKAALEDLVRKGSLWEQAHAHAALWAQDGDTERHVKALVLLLPGEKGDGGSTAAAAKISLESIGEPALSVLEREGAFKAALAKKAADVAGSIRSRMARKARRAGAS